MKGGFLQVLIGAIDDAEGRGLAVWADSGRILIDVSGDDWRELDDGTAARLISMLQEARTEASLQEMILDCDD
jgi:hypothetical protein